jgi:hypothetical protein
MVASALFVIFMISRIAIEFHILGIFFPRVGAKAALIGVIAGLVILIIIKNNTHLSFLLYGLIGMVAGIVIAILMSSIFPNKKDITGFTRLTINKKR